MHLLEVVRDFGIVAGQTVVKSNCKVGPVFCVFSTHYIVLSNMGEILSAYKIAGQHGDRQLS